MVLKVCPVKVSLHNLHMLRGFVEEPDLKGAQSVSSPRVHWQPLAWWDVGLELEGLKPEPDACQGFS